MYEQGDEVALQKISRRKPVVEKCVEEHIEQTAVQMAIENPALGKSVYPNELRKRGAYFTGSSALNWEMERYGDLPGTPESIVNQSGARGYQPR